HGKLSNQTQSIIQAKPTMAIIAYSPKADVNGTSKEAFHAMKSAGIKVVTYTWTNYGARVQADVKSDIDAQLAAGADGIFVDEVTTIQNEKEFAYYSEIYHYVKDGNESKIVVMNPGHFNVTESIMKISDVTSLEEDWVHSDMIPWKEKYPSDRFMGVS